MTFFCQRERHAFPVRLRARQGREATGRCSGFSFFVFLFTQAIKKMSAAYPFSAELHGMYRQMLVSAPSLQSSRSAALRSAGVFSKSGLDGTGGYVPGWSLPSPSAAAAVAVPSNPVILNASPVHALFVFALGHDPTTFADGGAPAITSSTAGAAPEGVQLPAAPQPSWHLIVVVPPRMSVNVPVSTARLGVAGSVSGMPSPVHNRRGVISSRSGESVLYAITPREDGGFTFTTASDTGRNLDVGGTSNWAYT